MPGFSGGLCRLAFVTLILLPSAVAGESAKTPANSDLAPPETVVVTGHRPPAQTLDKIIWNYVYAHGKESPKLHQLTRWVAPVCPEVRNLPPGYDAFISKRIKAIAASVGAPTKEPCKLNVEIIFTAQPQTIMDRVAESEPILLGYHFVHDKQAAAKVTAPIQAWYVTATSNGMETYIDDPYHGTPGGGAGSRLGEGLQSVFSHILILADTDKIAGYPVGPVADYIAMLALSKAEAPDDCAELPSILDLMSPDCPDSQKPKSLTVGDEAYLEGLYAMDPKKFGNLQRSNVAEHMKQSFQGQ
jgi:hypothetical protein